MKIISIAGVISLAFLCVPLISQAASSQLTGCAAKRQDIETQIDYARAHQNNAQEAGLKIALKQIVDHCTDKSLRSEREVDIKGKENKVAERNADLQKAETSGKTKKIAQQKIKLQTAEAELQEAKEQLLK